MRSTAQPVISTRSLALQQYDEAKKSTAVAPSPFKPRVAAAPQAKAATAAELKPEDGWDLCGWQDEPSVPAAARAAAVKLSPHQPALSPAQLSSSQHTPPAGSKLINSGGSSRRTAAVAAASSPSRRPAQGAGAQRSSKALEQQQHPAGKKLQLGEEDSYGAAAEHYRPPVLATEAAADAAAYAAAVGADERRSCCNSSRSCRPGDGSSNSTGSCCQFPSLQQGHQQHHTGITAAVAASILHQGLQQAADAQQAYTTAVDTICNSTDSEQLGDREELKDPLENTLSAARGTSRGAGGFLMPSTANRSLLPSTSSSNALISNILALQQRLLLPRPGAGLLSSSVVGSNSMSSSSTGALPVGVRATARPSSASHAQRLHGRGPGFAGQQAAVPGLALHARMASTAARAQLLLCRELTSMLPPPAPRARPEAAAPSAGGAAASSTSGGFTVGSGLCPIAGQEQQQQQQQLEELEAAGSSLHFVSSTNMRHTGYGSRPGSAAKGHTSRSGPAVAGATAAYAAPSTAVLDVHRPCSPHSSGSTSHTDYVLGSSSYTPVGATAGVSGTSGRLPVSATVGGVSCWGSSSGSEGGSNSGRPSTSGSGFGSFTAGAANISGSGSSVCESKGLSAAAEYMACKATVGELLQRINSQKAAGTGPSCWSPASGAASAGGAAAAAAAPAAGAGDTVFSRDGRQAGGLAAARGAAGKVDGGRQPAGLTHCSSLKAYHAFQSTGSLGSTIGSSQPCVVQSTSSGPSMSISGINISTNTLELRTNAALRKCGSNKR